MAEGWSLTTAGLLLRAQFRGLSYVETGLWAQLHVGPPGANGMNNIAATTTRVDATSAFGTDPSPENVITNDGEIGPFPDATVGETYTHISFHRASSGSGGFISSGSITAAAVSVGDPFSVPAGDCTATIPVAS